jgi:hypothetical protein
MKDNQHEELFTELTAESEVPAFTELDDEVAATCSGGVSYTGSNDPDVILYIDGGLEGDKLKVNASIGDGLELLGRKFNNKVSSFTILKGKWNFYADADFKGIYNSKPLGRGIYESLPGGFSNDQLSSLKRVG